MLSGEPLMDDASIRDLNEGIGCHVTSTLEQTLLLPRDMVELQDLRKNEIFQNTKRYLGMVWCKLPTVVDRKSTRLNSSHSDSSRMPSSA